MKHSFTRRDFLVASSGAVAATAWTGCGRASAAPQPHVSIRRVPAYDQSIYATVRQLMVEHKVAVEGKRVVVKPNLVEYDPNSCVNSNPIVVHAVYEAAKALGASEVVIAEGPGHRRGTLDLADAAGYFALVPQFEKNFVDLNLDRVSRMALVDPVSKLRELYLPNTALGADLLISVPKLKTHHWVGATLSMKNLFGLVPGAVYGWPKNVLHWAGIPECILDLNRLICQTFAVVDGVLGMEGNGPIQGKVKAAGVIVAGANLPAVDSTCCRIMGIDPRKIPYLSNANEGKQIGEQVQTVSTRFDLIPEFAHVRLS